MEEKVLSFIKTRFPNDSGWLSGNCYYFAIILQSRFPGGSIVYDVISGHFLYRLEGVYYDWSGKATPSLCLVDWDAFESYDPLQKERIVEDCLK